MTQIPKRCTPSLAVALIALFVALAGSAAAALLVTGDDVVDGSLTGADLAPRSVGVREVKDVAVGVQTTGADVIVGPTIKTIGALTVPAGAFLVNADATITGSSSATTTADCRLQAPDGAILQSVRNVLPDTAPKTPVSFSRVVVTDGGPFQLQCQRIGTNTNVTAQAISLNAVRLAGAGTRR